MYEALDCLEQISGVDPTSSSLTPLLPHRFYLSIPKTSGGVIILPGLSIEILSQAGPHQLLG
jgi:hypothetical protein